MYLLYCHAQQLCMFYPDTQGSSDVQTSGQGSVFHLQTYRASTVFPVINSSWKICCQCAPVSYSDLMIEQRKFNKHVQICLAFPQLVFSRFPDFFLLASLFKPPFLLNSGDFPITTIPSFIINMASRARLKAAHSGRQSKQEITAASHSLDRLSNKGTRYKRREQN